MNTSAAFAEKSKMKTALQAAGIMVFGCANAEADAGLQGDERVQTISIACAAMVRDVFILRAFEAGAEGVLVVGCNPESCKRGTGSAYAEKRVTRTKTILDEIGLGGWRLDFSTEKEAGKTLGRLIGEIEAHNDGRGTAAAEKRLPYVPGDYAALQEGKYRKL
jgi:coenzyme F420-reducing hydrogenase delta subunit